MKPRIWAKMQFMQLMASHAKRDLLRARARWKRLGRPQVHHFHQVDDPYSHLLVQKLDDFRKRYDVDIIHHLVSEPAPEFQGDAARFREWAIRDARSVADYYDTELSGQSHVIEAEQARRAEGLLTAHLNTGDFCDRAYEIGQSLWSDEPLDPNSAKDGLCDAGNKLREKLGHYLSATLYFEGEWYWGLDRMLHLEHRLIEEGFSRSPESICVPRPEPPALTKPATDVILEFYPSLRSPYTAISYDRVVAMAERTEVKLVLKPVMPMMMRGVPAPRPKQLYIMSDTRREADYYNQSFGPIVDPFGEPVKRAFSLLPFAIEHNAEIEFCANYLKAAWTEGVDITVEKGLRHVVETTGLDWAKASASMENAEWEPLLESNVTDMLNFGLWGVPSFRISGGARREPFCCWGQDRLWRVETEIIERTS